MIFMQCGKDPISVMLCMCVCVCVCVLVPLSKLQRGPRLCVIERGGRAADDHGGATVSSQ